MLELQLLFLKAYTFCENCTTQTPNMGAAMFYKKFWVSEWNKNKHKVYYTKNKRL